MKWILYVKSHFIVSWCCAPVVHCEGKNHFSIYIYIYIYNFSFPIYTQCTKKHTYFVSHTYVHPSLLHIHLYLSTHLLHTENSSTYLLSPKYIYIYLSHANYLLDTSISFMLMAITIFTTEFLLGSNIIFMTISI
jgi:hypothetical protein